MRDQSLIVTSRVEDCQEEDRVSGYTYGECDRCHSQVVLSPSSQNQMQLEPCIICCTRCIGDTERKELPEHLGLMPGQTEEFRDAIRRRLKNRI
jgi:hypothetical protein